MVITRLPRQRHRRSSRTRRPIRVRAITGLQVTGIRLGRAITGTRATGADGPTQARIGSGRAITATAIIGATGVDSVVGNGCLPAKELERDIAPIAVHHRK